MQVKVPFLGCDDSISSPAFSNASRCFLLQELFWSIQFQRRYEEAKGVAWGLPHRDVLHVCFQSLPPVLCKEDPSLRRKKRSICCIASLACLVFNTDASLGALVLPCILHLGSGSKSCKVWQFGYGKSTEPPTQGRMLLSLCSVSFSLCVTSFWEITPELLWAQQAFCHMWVLRPCSCLAFNGELLGGREMEPGVQFIAAICNRIHLSKVLLLDLINVLKLLSVI